MYKIFVCLCLLGGWRAVMQNITKFCPSREDSWQERRRQYGWQSTESFPLHAEPPKPIGGILYGRKGFGQRYLFFSHFHIIEPRHAKRVLTLYFRGKKLYFGGKKIDTFLHDKVFLSRF